MTLARPRGATLAQVAAGFAAANPSRPAIFYDGRSMSYGELVERSTVAAKGLVGLGLRPGERFGLLLGNEPQFVVMALAAAMAGLVLVPLNTWHKPAELSWTIRHAELAAVLSARRFLKTDYASVFCDLIPQLREADPAALPCPAFPQLRVVAFMEEAPAGALSFADLLAAGRGVTTGELVRRVPGPGSAALVLYTSGSTAEPKGVVLAHGGVVGNGFDLGQRRAIDADDRVWIGTPLFYALGATNALPAALTAGASIVLQGAFDAGRAIDVIRQTEATTYYGTGNMTRALLDHPDFSRAKTGSLSKGNAGTMAEYKRMTLVELGIRRAVPAYGLTETYGNATVGHADDDVAVKLATDGEPLPGMDIAIVDPVSGAPLRTGEIGLVLVRGRVTPGYLNSPTETAKALRPDGYFDTGDLGSFDANGRFVFHARLKEVIKTGGINVSPMEIEQLLAAHPDIRDAFVVGVADSVLGEKIIAFVDAAAPLSEDGLKAYVKERAASFKTPHHILFRSEDQLPRLATGKVAKHRLAAEARMELGL